MHFEERPQWIFNSYQDWKISVLFEILLKISIPKLYLVNHVQKVVWKEGEQLCSPSLENISH